MEELVPARPVARVAADGPVDVLHAEAGGGVLVARGVAEDELG